MTVTPLPRPAGALPFTDLSQWLERDPPARDWLVPGLIPYGCVTSLYGDGGSGKTMLALSLMVAMSSRYGSPWLGETPLGFKSVGLFAEDDEPELIRRLHRMAGAQGVTFGTVADHVSVLAGVGLDTIVATYGEAGELITTPVMDGILAKVRAEGASLLVLDYAAAIFAGNELDRLQVSDFMRRLNAIARAEGIAILLLGHPSMEGMKGGRGTSGSTAWRNQSRSFLHLTVDEHQTDEDDRARLTLKHTKCNYARAGRTWSLASDGSGFEILQTVEREPRRAAGPRLSASQKVALKALEKALDEGGEVSPGGPVPVGVRCVRVELWRQYAYSMGISAAGNAEANKKAFQLARAELLAKGKVGIAEPLAWLLEAGE